MKTVKIKNTVPSKIEPTNFASIINDMPRVKTQSPQMTAPQAESFGKSKDIIENYNAQKKLQDTYIRLKQNLEACREAKPDNIDNSKAESAIDHFENMVQTIEAKMDDMRLSAERQIQAIKDNLEKSLSTQQRKLNYAEEKLNKAKERKGKVKKTKEEIKLEKQLQQLLVDFKKTNPDKDLDYYFPNYKNLLGSAPLPPPQMDPPLASYETNKNLVVEPEEEEEEEEEQEEDFTQLTPWKRFQKANSYMSLYNQYHKAKEMGIEPEIEEPVKPVSKRQPRKTTVETVSRESLAKILPSFG